MLSSGGLGYFEYEATVDGDATLKLTVSLDQVDDVLKSLVVYDDKGGVGGLSLPGTRAAGADLQGPAVRPGVARLARRAAGGAEGRRGHGRRRRAPMTGRIVSVEEETAACDDGKTTTSARA